MKRTKMWIAGGAAALLVAGTGAGVAAASGQGDDNESPITGNDLDEASAAALQETGGGRVTETEVGDEDSYYEVEVTLPNGDQVDVQLDAQFNVADQMADSEADE
jgi:uncharacterized membrane protein YkoI